MDLYSVLGIPSDADDETIRSAFRLLARRYHPDRGAGSSSEKFRNIVEAYETLSDAGRRRAYDLSRAPARAPFRPPQPFDARRTQVYAVDRPPGVNPVRTVYGLDEIFNELLGALEDDFLFFDRFFLR